MGKVLGTFTNGFTGAVSRSIDNIIVSMKNGSGGEIPFGAPVFLAHGENACRTFDAQDSAAVARYGVAEERDSRTVGKLFDFPGIDCSGCGDCRKDRSCQSAGDQDDQGVSEPMRLFHFVAASFPFSCSFLPLENSGNNAAINQSPQAITTPAIPPMIIFFKEAVRKFGSLP